MKTSIYIYIYTVYLYNNFRKLGQLKAICIYIVVNINQLMTGRAPPGIWRFSIGTPNSWMVDFMENPNLKWMRTRGGPRT